ncbi:helix-turn-helix protein [Nocardia pseudobrasiliensis]|uniref:Helix-turn-helix protein n=2 Tax=Nocardia pseudobrasiliensis TaxID=45979 RepID=A0A370IDR0_9NOCA|nr:helix-turn-helix protein [Nocardia pseudobrasiliensis]
MAGFRVRDLNPLRMVPHPAVTLLLDIGPGSPILDGPGGWQRRGSLVAGPGFGSGGAILARGENVECVQVRLSPLIARAVLGVSPADFGAVAVPLGDLWGREASRIREQLDEISSWQDRFALIDALIARRYDTGPRVESEIAWAWRRVIGSRGLTRVDELADEIGWSRKRLWSRFRSQLGVAPKRAVKLVRFDHAAHRLVAGEPAARVAAETGYADQSHLHRDVVAFTGTTPATVTGEPFLNVDDIAWPSREM